MNVISVLIYITAVCGATGLYLLLPKPEGQSRRFGLALGLGALVGFAVLVGQVYIESQSHERAERVLFFVFSGLALLSGVMVVATRYPVYSALWMALTVLSVSGLYLILGAQFLAAATVVVYAGAIIVTFLFVIMLAQQSGIAPYDRSTREPMVATVSTFVLLAILLSALARVGDDSPVPLHAPAAEAVGITADAGHVASIGESLFTVHLISVEIAGVLLLVAMVGAIVISTSDPKAAEE